MNADQAYVILEMIEEYLENQPDEDARAAQLADAVGEILTWLEKM